MSYLILVRHGITEYNAKGIWTGWDDPELTNEGKEEAQKAGVAISDIQLDTAFSSDLQRAKETLEIIKKTLNKTNLPTTIAFELRERNYGDYTKKNKWEIKKQLGDEKFLKLRRSWDYPIPNGESLKQVYERVLPYYKTRIEPLLKSGKTVLISSSGNALRALIKYLENISDEDISKVEIGTGEAFVYQIDQTGNVLKKEIRAVNPKKV